MPTPPADVLLVRYGLIAEVARFPVQDMDCPQRGERVVVRTHRGLELGMVLERVRVAASSPSIPPGSGVDPAIGAVLTDDEDDATTAVVRVASPEDAATADRCRSDAQSAFMEWQTRIGDWKLDLELVDLEWTLDRQKLILYVLGGRGPDATKLALYAAARGTPVEVQPVSADGLVTLPTGGGCGTGNCGCH